MLVATFCSCGTKRITPATDSDDKAIGQYFTYLCDSLDVSDATARATADFEEGKYYILEFGEFITPYPTKEQLDSLYKTYKVRAYLGGCVVSESGNTYSQEMLRLLQEKKGINSYSLFNIIYANFNKREEETQRMILYAIDSTRLADSLANVDATQ